MSVNPAGGSGDKDGRDSASTPKWLADLLGLFDMDPCSNERSHIRAARCLMLPKDDGLFPGWGAGCYAKGRYVDVVKPECRTFINPPYARGEVIKWVKHWRGTRFCFLLRWDPSTEWFSELICHCTHVWFPSRRINFEPPPGVKFSSNPFPHALYLRDPPQDLLDRLASAGYLMPIDQDLLDFHLAGEQTDAHDRDDRQDDDAGDAGEAAQGGAGPSGGGPGEDLRGVRAEACWVDQIPEWIPPSDNYQWYAPLEKGQKYNWLLEEWKYPKGPAIKPK